MLVQELKLDNKLDAVWVSEPKWGSQVIKLEPSKKFASLLATVIWVLSAISPDHVTGLSLISIEVISLISPSLNTIAINKNLLSVPDVSKKTTLPPTFLVP